MDKRMLNYTVSMLLLLVFILTGATGIFKFLTVYDLIDVNVKYLPFFTINRIHDWSGVIMSLLVVAHVALNWDFIVSMTKKILDGGKR